MAPAPSVATALSILTLDVAPSGRFDRGGAGHTGVYATGADADAASLEDWRDAPLFLIFGGLKSRDPKDFLTPLAASVRALEAVAIPGEDNTLSAQECAAAARAVGIPAAPAAGTGEAIDAIASAEPGGGRILICGSLYLAGHVLTQNG